MLLRLDGRLIRYDDLPPSDGVAPRTTVLLLHSLVADSGMWAEQIGPLLSDGCRVVAVDFRGHGGSSASPGDYALSMLADDVMAVLRHVDAGRVHVVGSSLGGMVAQALALDHPERVRSLLLVGSLPRSPQSQSLWEERIRLVSAAGSCEPLADPILARWFDAAFAASRPSRLRQLRESLAATSVVGFLGCAAAIRSFDFTTRLPALRIPVLAVCGSEDVSTPEADNRLIASLVSGGRFESIAGARHLPNIEMPDRFNRLLLAWLATCALNPDVASPHVALQGPP